MPQLELHLKPTPDAKAEYLSIVETSNTSGEWQVPPKVVLENYTRDAWATKPEKGLFQTVMVKSVDKRQKLPGFLKYLKDRQKAAYGRFGNDGVWVISHVQPPSKDTAATSMMCRYSLTLSQIPNCPLAKHKPRKAAEKPNPMAAPPPRPAQSKTTSKPGGGLLGNLLGAQRRTNQHVLDTMSQKPQQQQKPQQTTNATTPSSSTADNNGSATTGQEVLAQFRQKMEQRFLDFDISSETVIKVPISLAKETANLVTEEEKQKVTMEVLKYIVYEQSDEINEEWVAHKEPSEFMDEVAITVYKEGHAPPEVLEDVNKGDLPDEIRGQQRAVQDAIRKQAAQKESKIVKERMKQATQADDDDVATLNTSKRDRRTIEEIQRDMGQDQKRQKSE